MKTAEEWIELAAIEYSKHGQKNRLDFIRAIQQDAQQAALIKQLGEALFMTRSKSILGNNPYSSGYLDAFSAEIKNNEAITVAIDAYNNYLRERAG